MSNFQEIIPVAKTVLESIKRIFQLLSTGRYLAAVKEFFNLFKVTYTNHIKGRYITIKGKNIPLAAVLAVVVVFLYIVYPSQQEKVAEQAKPTISEAEMLAQSNYYNQDGIIIDKMHKCDAAVCGNLENTNDEDISSITIPVAFFDKEGILVYEGRIKATNVPVKENKEFQIPSEVPFDFFKLGVVIVEK
jgi:hypothetical protein